MKLRLSLLASVVFAMALALAGVLNDVSSTRATIPLPVQPFSPLSKGGISSNLLGASIASNFTITEAEAGERITLPWIFSGSGWSSDKDADWPDDVSNVGDVWSELDVDCNGTIDYLAGNNCVKVGGNWVPVTWWERTTNVGGTAEAYLLTIMPPANSFTWQLRHRADIAVVCTPGPLGSPSVLNTVYATVDFGRSLSGKVPFVAQTQLGGSAGTPPSKICLDSPQTSESNTKVYNAPPLVADGVDADSLADSSGIYARWTIFQSKGSASLNYNGDLRKPYEGLPSFPSDNNYVERTLQLECFWMDGTACGSQCQRDGDNRFISPEESFWDPDLLTFTGELTGPLARAHIDADGDCLMNVDHAQPVFFSAGAYESVADDTKSGTNCPASDWSGPPPSGSPPTRAVYDDHADRDCDGLVDGVEWSYGTDAEDADSDNDLADDFVEMFQFTNPLVQDSDSDGHLDKPVDTYTNDGTGRDIDGNLVPTDPNMDNCPAVSNPDQLNTDGGRRPAGTNIPYATFASNANQDKTGDLCDWDDDNDGATDTYEVLTSFTNPLHNDWDKDGVIDGVEIKFQAGGDPFVDPKDPLLFPVWSNAEQTYYRGCQIHVNVADHPEYAVNKPIGGNVEMDVDGDGVLCVITGNSDLDSDNGSSTSPGALIKTEVNDNVEAFGFGTSITNVDTDGDGCEDWVEIHDLNGDRKVTGADALVLAKAQAGSIPSGDPLSFDIFDVNQDARLSGADLLQIAKNSCLVKGWGGCPDGCSAEN